MNIVRIPTAADVWHELTRAATDAALTVAGRHTIAAATVLALVVTAAVLAAASAARHLGSPIDGPILTERDRVSRNARSAG